MKMENHGLLNLTFVLFLLYLDDKVIGKGNHFQIVYFKHGYPQIPPEYMYIVINSNQQSANITVHISAFPNYTSNILVDGNGGFYLGNLTDQLLLLDTVNERKHVMTLRSDIDVTVIARNSRTYAMDAYLVIPVTYSAYEYYVAPYCSQNTSSSSKCLVGIVAVNSNTDVTYVMPGNTVTLTAGDIAGKKSFTAYERLSENLNFDDIKILEGTNLIGMKVVANDVINVFVGNTLGSFYEGNNKDFTDEQVMPVNRWGLSYLVARSTSTDDRMWIIARYEETKIYILSNLYSNEQYTITNAGEIFDFLIVDEAYYITADKPIGITHFVLNSNGLKFTMYQVTPIEQYASEAVTFVTETSVTGDVNVKFAGAVIFTNTNMTSSLTYDGKTLSNSTDWVDIANSGMSVTTVQMSTQETHRFQQISPCGILGGYVFAFDKYAIFAHALTTSFKDMDFECDGPCNETTEGKFSCQNNTSVVTSETQCAAIYLPDSHTYSNELYYNCSSYPDTVNKTNTDTQSFDRLISEMTVDIKDSSKYRRRKSSADDKRHSSTAIGVVISFLTMGVVGAFMYLDIKELFTMISSGFKSLVK